MKPTSISTASSGTAYTAASSSINTKDASSLGLLLEYTVAAATAKTFADADVNTSTDRITITAHGYLTGRKVAATTTGTLPGGLSATDYYIIKVDADTIKLATSSANAQAGTAVDITSAAGGGTHTLTPAAISGASYKLQGSFDDSTWFDIVANDSNASTGNITATGSTFYQNSIIAYNYIRAYFTISTAGQFTYTITVLLKG